MLKKNLPNIITLTNLLMGCLSILSVLLGNLYEAALFILLAALMDFLDGTLARLLHAKSLLGKQLDSLADIVSFGVAPALVIYSLMIHSNNPPAFIDWMAMVSFLIPICSAVRLAKFNIDKTQDETFRGLPVPANAIFIASFPLILSQIQLSTYWISEIILNPWFLVVFTLFSSFLLVSPIRLVSLKFKGYGWKGNQTKYLLILISLVLIIILQSIAIPLILLLYILLSVIDNTLSNKTKQRS